MKPRTKVNFYSQMENVVHHDKHIRSQSLRQYTVSSSTTHSYPFHGFLFVPITRRVHFKSRNLQLTKVNTPIYGELVIFSRDYTLLTGSYRINDFCFFFSQSRSSFPPLSAHFFGLYNVRINTEEWKMLLRHRSSHKTSIT